MISMDEKRNYSDSGAGTKHVGHGATETRGSIRSGRRAIRIAPQRMEKAKWIVDYINRDQQPYARYL